MAKITDFTWSEFLEAQDRYNDMLDELEYRIIEIANDLGHAYKPHHLKDIFFQHDENHMYVVGEFNISGEEEDVEYFKAQSDWLFSDDYKAKIEEEKARQQRKEAEEYQEYIRLKKKFEGDSEC